MRDYFDNRWDGVTLGPEDLVRSPTAIANFTSQYAFEGDAPCEWAERLYNVQGWTPWSAVGISHPRKNQWLSARTLQRFSQVQFRKQRLGVSGYDRVPARRALAADASELMREEWGGE